jgi:hypothetical protein
MLRLVLNTPSSRLSENDDLGGQKYGFWGGCLVSLSNQPSSGGSPSHGNTVPPVLTIVIFWVFLVGYGYPPQGFMGGRQMPLELTEPFVIVGELWSV